MQLVHMLILKKLVDTVVDRNLRNKTQEITKQSIMGSGRIISKAGAKILALKKMWETTY